MYNTALLNPEVQDFIRNYDGEIHKLILSGSPFTDIPVVELAEQIESRRRIEKKLPTWFHTPGIIYPPKLNLEQTSSEITAQYKAALLSGKSMADITGGFGVDIFYFSDSFDKSFHFEINSELSDISRHNFSILGKDSIHCESQDGMEMALTNKYDLIYADPSRRHQTKGKVFFLEDCEPNIVDNLLKILDNCNVFLIKTSPMLDISQGLQEISNVAEIHIVAVENEVKELLWLLRNGHMENPKIKTLNIKKDFVDVFSFDWENKGLAEYGLPENYLYEPNAAILKSGAFNLVAEEYNLKKLHPNTHLYTNNSIIEFPGRRFEIKEVVPYSKSPIKKALTFKKANITTRNFPESVENLRKKWKIKDGGNKYLFFVTDMEDQKQMLVCEKI